MVVAPLGDADAQPVVEAVARWQRDPSRHVCFTGTTADEVATDFAEVARWRSRTVVARDEEGAVVGVVLADVDEDRGRVWWFGPWGVDEESCAAVLDEARAALPAGVVEEDYGPDSRNEVVAAVAAARGAVAGTASSVLVLDPLVAPTARDVPGVVVAPLAPDRAAAVAALHDQLFPGTHTLGRALVADDSDDEVQVAVEDGRVVGYVATEVHADGSLYVDFLGTEPSARRRGIASMLIVDALRRGAADGRPRSHLTVRQDAVGARALYLALGYLEERVIVPWRIGFGER